MHCQNEENLYTSNKTPNMPKNEPFEYSITIFSTKHFVYNGRYPKYFFFFL